MTTSESKGRFFNKTNRLESIRITNRFESIRIANWNALLRGDADDGKSVCVNVYVSWCVCEGSTVSALATAASADVISACVYVSCVSVSVCVCVCVCGDQRLCTLSVAAAARCRQSISGQAAARRRPVSCLLLLDLITQRQPITESVSQSVSQES